MDLRRCLRATLILYVAMNKLVFEGMNAGAIKG